MQPRWVLLFIALAFLGAPGLAADQTGAEHTKKVVSAQIVPAGGAPKGAPKTDADTVAGNVQVTYADGTKDLWTTKGGCVLANAADDGTVGWTVLGAPVHINSGDPVRPNPELVVCRQGKILARIHPALPFIEDWNFLAGGSQLALRCRGGHGPADIELHDSATGKLVATVKAYADNLPAWAAPLRDQ